MERKNSHHDFYDDIAHWTPLDPQKIALQQVKSTQTNPQHQNDYLDDDFLKPIHHDRSSFLFANEDFEINLRKTVSVQPHI